MKVYILLSFLGFWGTVSAQDEEFPKACSRENRDCSCKDVSYEICHTPPAAQELHVGSLEECIQNCDLFGSFDQCNYLLYWETGPDENCKLIADTTLEQYLDACRVFGQPLRNANNQCVSGYFSDTCALVGCSDTTCHTCNTVDDGCGLYSQTECEKFGSPGETSENIPSFEKCLSLCSIQQQSNPFTYVVYDKEQQECICYPDGLRGCQITAVPFGMTVDDAERCDGCETDADCPVARPICSVVTGRCVECEENADCTDSSKPFCDLDANICKPDDCELCCESDDDCADPTHCDTVDHLCKPECTADTDCADTDYCKCHDGSDHGNTCPAEDGGSCVVGCRDPGMECDGSGKKCAGDHTCREDGEASLTKLFLETRDCAGCSSLKADPSGATLLMTTANPTGAENCTTNILDNSTTTDYAIGVKAVFDDDDDLSECFMANLDALAKFEVTWTGAGTWTPEKFILERREEMAWPYCCFNDAGVSVSDGETKEFTCVESSYNTYGMECEQA